MGRKGLLCAFSLALILLVSCSPATAEALPAATETAILGEYRFLVPEGSDSIVIRAAEAFCTRAGEALGMRLTVSESEHPAADLAEPDVRFALSKATGENWSPLFTLLTQPFQYESYEHFTMAANSRTVLSALEKDLAPKGVLPLACFYTGSHFLLSSLELEDYREFRGGAVEVDGVETLLNAPVLAMPVERAESRYAYEQAGSVVLVLEDGAARMAALQSNEIQSAEFAFTDDVFQDGVWWEFLFLTRSWQNIQPLWLMGDQGYVEGLNPAQDAMLREAVAEMYAGMDKIYLARENMLLNELREWGVLESGDFTRTRRRLQQDASSLAKPAVEAKRVLDYVSSLGG